MSQITFEIGQIDELLDRYTGLLSRVLDHEPDEVEIAAVASVLHSFYNGIESVFAVVAKLIDDSVPTGSQWHRDLLTQMMRSTEAREPVVSAELGTHLLDYLAFRHFYRHAYSFLLNWMDLRRLVVPLHKVWNTTKSELLMFVGNLSA